MPLILGGVVLVLFALLSLSASQGEEARKNVTNTIVGSLLVSAVCFVLLRSGLPWLAVIVVLFFTAGRRFLAHGSRQRGSASRDTEPPRGRGNANVSGSGEMSRDEAYAILGLEAGATRDAILEAYKRLMKKMHPDQGGTTYLAQRINQARDVLVGK